MLFESENQAYCLLIRASSILKGSMWFCRCFQRGLRDPGKVAFGYQEQQRLSKQRGSP